MRYSEDVHGPAEQVREIVDSTCGCEGGYGFHSAGYDDGVITSEL